VFTPFRTERLLIRDMALDDVESFHARRNHPEVARYQNWTLPFSMEEAQRIIASCSIMEGPERDGWWMVTIADPDTDEPVGDLAIHLSATGHFSEIGYTLHPDHWRKGYAVEATAALVDYLFAEVGVTRVFGMLHPDNPPSAQVLERVGMLFEGHTKSSFVLDGEVSDDWIYGMTRADWEAWRDRPRHRPAEVSLVEVTDDNVMEIYRLATHKTQESMVAPVPKSLAQALVAHTFAEEPLTAWYRAIYADGIPAGFVMVALSAEVGKEPHLWRLLVDRMHQRRGIGGMALDLVEQEMRDLGHGSWVVSWVPGRGSPEPFYRARGFEPTGEVDDGEVEARQQL
jgi:RimJ/RimL family protein N-acetyltransferase/ribosomal protein S18 acetylase RimI-like enzyme